MRNPACDNGRKRIQRLGTSGLLERLRRAPGREEKPGKLDVRRRVAGIDLDSETMLALGISPLMSILICERKRCVRFGKRRVECERAVRCIHRANAHAVRGNAGEIWSHFEGGTQSGVRASVRLVEIDCALEVIDCGGHCATTEVELRSEIKVVSVKIARAAIAHWH